jgi:hypothetical protein
LVSRQDVAIDRRLKFVVFVFGMGSSLCCELLRVRNSEALAVVRRLTAGGELSCGVVSRETGGTGWPVTNAPLSEVHSRVHSTGRGTLTLAVARATLLVLKKVSERHAREQREQEGGIKTWGANDYIFSSDKTSKPTGNRNNHVSPEMYLLYVLRRLLVIALRLTQATACGLSRCRGSIQSLGNWLGWQLLAWPQQAAPVPHT